MISFCFHGMAYREAHTISPFSSSRFHIVNSRTQKETVPVGPNTQ